MIRDRLQKMRIDLLAKYIAKDGQGLETRIMEKERANLGAALRRVVWPPLRRRRCSISPSLSSHCLASTLSVSSRSARVWGACCRDVPCPRVVARSLVPPTLTCDSRVALLCQSRTLASCSI
jgi:hypothetical protein